AVALENSSRRSRRTPHWIVAVPGRTPMHRAAECDPAHIAARDYFDIFSLDIPSFDILSLDIWSFDMLSFFMPLSFDMLSLLMSSANAAGTAKAKASAIAATGNSKRERTIILVLRYVV